MSDVIEFDVLVLGGGTAGTAAAKTAAAEGMRTAMFNAGELGGLCILRGCMPTKTMLHAAHLRHESAHHHTPGIGQSQLDFDFPTVMDNKDAKVARFKAAKIRGIESGGYEVIDAYARFTGPDTVRAGDRTYRFTRGAVLATGSRQSVPPIPGLAETSYWTSDDVMRLRERPDSLVVLGSGAIGVEFSYFFARMGTEVHLVSRRPVYQDAGPVIRDEMAAALAAEPNLHAHHPASPLCVQQDEAGVAVEIETASGREWVRGEHLLLATGRKAALQDMGLDQAGIEVERGRVVCGPDMRTSNERVFVAGDATGSRLLLHVANWEGRVAGLGASGTPGEHRVEQRLHLEVIFSDPTLALVGMNEDAARAAGHDPVVASSRYPETGRAITMDVQHGAAVLVCERSTGEILGAQLLGPRADDTIHSIAVAMYYRGTAAQLLEMPWYHPTISEVFMELARSVEAQRR